MANLLKISKLFSSSFSSASGKTKYYNHNSGDWSDGPNLIKGRYNHGAGIVTDEATLDMIVVVTGGKHGSNILKSTETLIGGVWSIGKKDIPSLVSILV